MRGQWEWRKWKEIYLLQLKETAVKISDKRKVSDKRMNLKQTASASDFRNFSVCFNILDEKQNLGKRGFLLTMQAGLSIQFKSGIAVVLWFNFILTCSYAFKFGFSIHTLNSPEARRKCLHVLTCWPPEWQKYSAHLSLAGDREPSI